MILLANQNYKNDGIYIKKEIAKKIIDNYGTDLLKLPETKITLESLEN